MKLCKDCAHCAPGWIFNGGLYSYSVSANYATSKCKVTDRVTGQGVVGTLCQIERIKGACGPDALLFEEKPPEPPEPKPLFVLEAEPETKRPWWRFWR